MFESMPRAENQKESKPFRERTPVWNSIVEEGVEKMLMDDIVGQVAASPNELYHFSRESGFREKLRASATAAIDVLLRDDQKNFADPIDAQTDRWDHALAESGMDPHDEIEERGNILMKSLAALSGGKENLVKKVLAIMIDQEKRRVSENHEKNLQ